MQKLQGKFDLTLESRTAKAGAFLVTQLLLPLTKPVTAPSGDGNTPVAILPVRASYCCSWGSHPRTKRSTELGDEQK